jgi:hypothetical protein
MLKLPQAQHMIGRGSASEVGRESFATDQASSTLHILAAIGIHRSFSGAQCTASMGHRHVLHDVLAIAFADPA